VPRRSARSRKEVASRFDHLYAHISDPKELLDEEFRAIRDQIGRQVHELLERLEERIP
jgi:protein-tyrosine-phosphatase